MERLKEASECFAEALSFLPKNHGISKYYANAIFFLELFLPSHPIEEYKCTVQHFYAMLKKGMVDKKALSEAVEEVIEAGVKHGSIHEYKEAMRCFHLALKHTRDEDITTKHTIIQEVIKIGIYHDFRRYHDDAVKCFLEALSHANILVLETVEKIKSLLANSLQKLGEEHLALIVKLNMESKKSEKHVEGMFEHAVYAADCFGASYGLLLGLQKGPAQPTAEDLD